MIRISHESIITRVIPVFMATLCRVTKTANHQQSSARPSVNMLHMTAQLPALDKGVVGQSPHPVPDS